MCIMTRLFPGLNDSNCHSFLLNMSFFFFFFGLNIMTSLGIEILKKTAPHRNGFCSCETDSIKGLNLARTQTGT